MVGSTRWVLVVGLLLVAPQWACGPSAGGSGDGSGGALDETGDSDGGGQSGPVTADSSGAGDSSGDGESTGSVDTGGEATECWGGDSLVPSTSSLNPRPSAGADPWATGDVVQLECAVVEVEELDDAWNAVIECGFEGDTIALDWHVAKDLGLLDATWQGAALGLAGRGQFDAVSGGFSGWLVLRDDAGELLWISGGPSVPDPEFTAPVEVSMPEIGRECLNGESDSCLAVYDYPVVFASPTDGDLRCFDGRGYVTESFSYTGRATEWVNLDRDPFDPEPCGEVFDLPQGIRADYTMVRRG